MQFLLDTGCNTNLLSKKVFDRLPERIRAGLEECNTHGVMADGTRLPFYGVLRVAGRLRDVKMEEAFVVSRLGEDVILGMPFLAAHQCTLNFGKPLLKIGGRELACTDRHGRLLETKVQAVRKVTIPASAEMTVQCRVTTRNYYPLGVIEGETEGVLLAASLNRPDRAGRVMVRCLNTTNQPLTLAAGTTVGTYTGVEGQDVLSMTEGSKDRIRMPSAEGMAAETAQSQADGVERYDPGAACRTDGSRDCPESGDGVERYDPGAAYKTYGSRDCPETGDGVERHDPGAACRTDGSRDCPEPGEGVERHDPGAACEQMAVGDCPETGDGVERYDPGAACRATGSRDCLGPDGRGQRLFLWTQGNHRTG